VVVPKSLIDLAKKYLRLKITVQRLIRCNLILFHLKSDFFCLDNGSTIQLVSAKGVWLRCIALGSAIDAILSSQTQPSHSFVMTCRSFAGKFTANVRLN